MENKIKIAITQGDSNGIGYEIILKAFANPEVFDICTPVVYGSEKILQIHRKALELNTPYRIISSADDAYDNHLNLIDVAEEGSEPSVVFGQPTEESGRMALLALKAAVRDAKEGSVDAIVTCPINLAAMPKDEFPYSSQNEYLGGKYESECLMMLCNSYMRVAFATNHLPLSEVTGKITPELIESRIRQAYESVCRDFLCASPRVAVLGLNPHASSNGLFGSEESDVISPAISKLADSDIRVFGPYAADGFFGAGMYKHFDCVLALYHDQGVAPFKALAMEDGVNFTAGLDVVAVAPDHGPAYDKAGKNEASEVSFLHALYTAVDVVRHRNLYDASHANPLPHIVQHDKREDRRPRREE